MKIGIGLPNPIPGTRGRTLVDWARRAEERGFSTLATIDRIVYPSYESLIALAAAAGATERIGLMTNVLLEPTRNPVLLAKEAASIDQLSSGRFTLGMSVGGRPDDFDVVGLPFNNRGKRFDHDLELMHKAWAGEPVPGADKPVAPTPFNGKNVPILIGGRAEEAVRRTVKWATGWTSGGGGPEAAGRMVQQIKGAWKEAGREGEPRLVALHYFALGRNAEQLGARYITDYYGTAPWTQNMIATMPRTPRAIKDAMAAFEASGITELIFDPTIAEVDQVDMLADVVSGGG